jgi:two-component system chemotaxis sensor kinase CheA
MPHMDGFTLTARLRQEENYRERPIIIVTSLAKEEDKRRGIQAGADAYIVKGDFDRSNLVDTLRSLLA